ncbi:hypothetical protein AOLI_G00152290 [Acnodon oligacanthus]
MRVKFHVQYCAETSRDKGKQREVWDWYLERSGQGNFGLPFPYALREETAAVAALMHSGILDQWDGKMGRMGLQPVMSGLGNHRMSL